MDVVMSQDTTPLFYYGRNMLSCDRTRCPLDVIMSHDTPPPFFIMGEICCPMDVVKSHDTPPPPGFIIAENVIHSNICRVVAEV